MDLNEWGDFLGGFSAPLALLWLVIGFFQQGEELKLNTEALRAQQEELRRQVEETAFLARNADRQAAAAELLANLNKTEKEKLEQREKAEAQPVFWVSGGSVSAHIVKTTVTNRGGEVTNVRIVYSGPHALSFTRPRLWKAGAEAEFVLQQKTELVFPIRFGCQYVDKFGSEHESQLEFVSAVDIREVRTAPSN